MNGVNPKSLVAALPPPIIPGKPRHYTLISYTLNYVTPFLFTAKWNLNGEFMFAEQGWTRKPSPQQ